MALSIGSQILVSDISNALAGKQDALGYVPIKSVNGTTADASGNVAISAGITTVKAQIGSAWAANSTSMTLPSGGTWFVFNAGSYGNDAWSTWSGVRVGNGSFVEYGTTASGGSTIKAQIRQDRESSYGYNDYGKPVGVRIA